jgi:hypothetical protein
MRDNVSGREGSIKDLKSVDLVSSLKLEPMRPRSSTFASMAGPAGFEDRGSGEKARTPTAESPPVTQGATAL